MTAELLQELDRLGLLSEPVVTLPARDYARLVLRYLWLVLRGKV